MNKLEYKIHDSAPNEIEGGRHYGKAIFWSIFAIVVAGLGIVSRMAGEIYLVPLLLGLAVLGLFAALRQLSEGGAE